MPDNAEQWTIGHGRRRAAVWTTGFGASGVPAGILLEETLLMLGALVVLWMAAGLWHPQHHQRRERSRPRGRVA